MTNSKQQIGNQGEKLALGCLQQNSYTILETNWRCKFGEIDIIAVQNRTLVFIEVKTRRSATTESALASITSAKCEKMIKAAHAYLHEHNLSDETVWRVDVIAVALPYGKKPLIDHVEDALGW